MLSRYYAVQNADLGSVTQRLVNDAVALSQSNQRGELFFAGVGVQIEMQSNFLKADGHVHGNAERSAEIEIAFRANCRIT